MTVRYTSGQQTLHWVTVLAMFAVLPVAWVVVSLKEDTPKFLFWLDVHKALGLLILALTLVRIAWRLVERPPPHPGSMGAASRLLAGVVAIGLLALMIVMPASGYVWTTGHGFDVDPFGLPHLPRLFWKNKAAGDAAKAVHHFGQYVVYGLIGLHLTGVSFHLLVKRDGLLARMLPPQALG